jgi:multidrug efflux pump subunit AcrA (membrane-fusion protein)
MSAPGRRPAPIRSVPRATILALMATICLAALVGCGGDKPASDASADSQAGAVQMAVNGARVTVAPMQEQLRLLGATVALRHLSLRAPAAGRVIDFDLRSGERVRRGQVVARVVNREVEAAENGLAVARKIDRDESAALSAAVKRNVSGAAIAVYAPADAVVAQPQVSNGQMVADLDPLADLIDPRSVYVEAAAPLSAVASIRPGMPAIVLSPLKPGLRMAARVVAFSPTFSQGSATVPIRIEFSGPDRIEHAGAPAEVVVITASVPDAIVVPDAALFEDAANQARFVFVAGADGRAHRRIVTLGIRNEQETQVSSGLKPGEIVVTSGGYALADGLRVQTTVANR